MPVAVGTGGDSVWEVTGGGNAKYDGAVISTSYYKSADDGLQLRDSAVSVSRVDNDLVLSTANTERLKIGADGSILMTDNSGNNLFKVNATSTHINTSVLKAPNHETISGSEYVPNMHITDSGYIRKTTATTYSAEEVDKKLAIKDKIIEKLSARLDALEKRVK